MNVCSSAKRGYFSHNAAMRIAHRQMLRQEKVVLSVYRCEECKQWHMTSSPQKMTLRTARYVWKKIQQW